MVKYALQIRARLENVQTLSLDEDLDTRFYVKLRCNNCGELTGGDNGSCVYFDGHLQPTTSGQEANYVAHCKFCRRLITMSIVPKSYRPYVDKEEAEPTFSTVIEFDGRGAEPFHFEFHGTDWKVRAAHSPTTFNDLDLSTPEKDGIDWCDFDDETKETIGVYNLEARFQVS